MSHPNHVIDILGAYALHALDETEAERVRLHLEECAACRMELSSYMEVASRLAQASQGPAPSPLLREKVQARVVAAAQADNPPKRSVHPVTGFRRLAWVGIIAALALVASQVWLLSELSSLRRQLDAQNQIQRILLTYDEKPIKLQPPDPASPAHGSYRYDPDIHLGLLNTYRLSPPDPGQSYQCWVDFSSTGTQPCGRLDLENDGSGIVLISWKDDPPIRVHVTLESLPTAVPTGPTILSTDVILDQDE